MAQVSTNGIAYGALKSASSRLSICRLVCLIEPLDGLRNFTHYAGNPETRKERALNLVFSDVEFTQPQRVNFEWNLMSEQRKLASNDQFTHRPVDGRDVKNFGAHFPVMRHGLGCEFTNYDG